MYLMMLTETICVFFVILKWSGFIKKFLLLNSFLITYILYYKRDDIFYVKIYYAWPYTFSETRDTLWEMLKNDGKAELSVFDKKMCTSSGTVLFLKIYFCNYLLLVSSFLLKVTMINIRIVKESILFDTCGSK